MTSFNPERLLAPVGIGNAASITGWEPGTVAFPDLDDFVSLLNTATQPRQQFASNLSPNGLPLDPLESLLLSAENNVLNDVPQPALDMDFIFGDVNPLFGSSPSPVQSASPLAQPDVSPSSQGVGRNSVSASPLESLVPLPPSPASIGSQHSDEGRGEVVAAAPAPGGGKKRKMTAEEKEEKDKRRAIRNRAAAQESRDKKKKYMEDLEQTNATLSQQNQQLASRLETVEATNTTLMSRLEELASQLTSLRSQFQKSTNPTSATTSILPQQFITIPHNPSPASSTFDYNSDPAAVASQQRILSNSRTRTSLPSSATTTILGNHHVVPPTTSYSYRSYSTTPLPSTAVLSTSNDMLTTHQNPGQHAITTVQQAQTTDPSTATLVSTQAHPLAFIVATAILHSMVSMISRVRTLPSSAVVSTTGRRGTLGSDLWTPADGAVTGASSQNGSHGVLVGGKRKGLGLLPDLNGYVGLTASGRLARFPVLRSIWEGKVGGKAVVV